MRLPRHAAALAAATVAVGWLATNTGMGFVEPTNTGWLLSRDWAAGYLGWSFFRDAPWGWPLGHNPAYPFPVGSTLAYADGLPIVAVALKPLAPLLPPDFQFVGAWIVLCFALQGFVGAKLTALATPSPIQQLLGGMLFALAPPLLHRFLGANTGHASLCAHWLLLAFLWVAVAPLATGSRAVARRLALAAALLLVATGLHPYLAVFGIALSAAVVVRIALLERRLDAARAVSALAALLAIAAAGLTAFGYLGSPARAATEGFGWFSADLLALFAPLGWSRFWAGPAVGPGQYEGFAYLGAGCGLLLVVSVLLIRRSPRSAVIAAAPAIVAALLLAMFALSSRVTLAATPLVDLGWDRLAPGLVGAFRSSGRFVWALHYAVLLAAISVVAFALRARPRLATGVLAAAVALQVADVRPPADARLELPDHGPPSSVWLQARGDFRHVVLHPPVLVDGAGPVAPEACGGQFWTGYAWLGTIAARIGATYNSAYLARMDPSIAAACERWLARLAAADLDPETLYVVHPSAIPLFRAANGICGAIDGVPVCVSRLRTTRLAGELARFEASLR